MNMTVVAIMAVIMLSLGVGFIYFVVRENEKPMPQGGMQWTAVVLSALLVVFSGFLLALTFVPAEQVEAFSDGMNQPAANFPFRLLSDESEQGLEHYEGKVVLLNFWATWCQPCFQEFPDLDRLQQNYGGDGLVVITISDEPRDLLLKYTSLLPQQTVTGYFNLNDMPMPFSRDLEPGRPVSYIIDREGVLRRHVLGAGNYTFFEDLIQPYLGDTMAVR